MNSTDGMDTSNAHYTTVTLDMGYTLVELKNNFQFELLRLAGDAGLHVTHDDIRSAEHRFWQKQNALDAERIWQPSLAADEEMSFQIDAGICTELGICDPELHRAANEAAKRLFHDPATFTVYPDVMATLADLRERGLTMGIISNWDWHLEDMCDILGLAPYFDFILSSARIGASKPHPAIFRAALSCAGSLPAQTLHVGDSLAADVRGAQGVGITGVLLDRTCTHPGAEDHPTIFSLDQLPALF